MQAVQAVAEVQVLHPVEQAVQPAVADKVFEAAENLPSPQAVHFPVVAEGS
jgi:hypothetical protein